LVACDWLCSTHHTIFMEFLNSIKSLSDCCCVRLVEWRRLCRLAAVCCRNSS
jgi:hypothetical protein